jgi:6-phosphogluconate dehydrogenase
MELGMIGLGTMGGRMLRRLHEHGHRLVGMDTEERARAEIGDIVTTVGAVDDLLAELSRPRIVWLMLPAGPITAMTIEALAAQLEADDLVVDGGNSHFVDAVAHERLLAARGAAFCDVGVSGGRWGWKTGYGLMVGGSPSDVERIVPALEALAAPQAYAHVGPTGTGHLVKAIHNGVQYALLQAYAEGYALLEAHEGLDAVAALRVYQSGCSIRSFLLEQVVSALEEHGNLADIPVGVADSGMGRWTAEEAIRLAVPTPTLATALHARFTSRDGGTAFRVLNAARSQVGGQPT